jgi:chromosome segregation ATPase
VSAESDRVAGIIFAEIENLKSAPSEETDALAADLHEAVTLIFSRATAREDERRKKVEHEAIVPQCRAAKDRFDKLNADAEKQNHILAELRRQLDQAESRLNLKRDARPAPYPRPSEISEWENDCKKLEEALESARAEVRAANVRRSELTGEVIRARNDFTNLMFRERNLRPRQTEPYQGIELAGVR